IAFSMYASGNGYILEASIPWSTIGVTPALGKAIGLDVQVDDDDNGGTRDAQTASFATNTTAWQNPGVFGTVYLTTCSGPVNQPPVANAGSDLSLASGTTSVTLSGSGSDPDGTAVTYSWTKVSGPAATITNATTASPTVSGLTNGSIYVFQLTVSDGSLTATDQVQVSVAGTSGDPAGVITCYQRVSTITVDGTLNESSWNVTRAVSKNTVNTPNNTVTFGVLWDNTNLYIGVKVLDASLYNDSPDIWENDAVEIYIDANNNKLSTYDGRDNQFIKGYNNSALFAKLSVTGVQHAWAAISGGYSVELSIPWSQLNVTPANGITLGFDVGYDDDDNGGSREGQAVWNGAVNNYENTSAFGSLVLNSNTGARFGVPAEYIPDDETRVSVYPNPVKRGETTIRINGLKNTAGLQVVNTSGTVVKSQTLQKQEEVIDLSGAAHGVYLLRVQLDNRQVTRKILIE
ncbi:MAG TPA: sugar-binding protein, partial [Ohtaekwangia sp.]|uniref:sugar-binding protein n=1 Tax=Ohtaekwangia sp. TaxID=2066019 RepID=UPI002F9557F3